MERLIAFGLLSLPIIYLSWRTLFSIKSDGFYRFFNWECILWLFVSNFKNWFVEPFSTKQVISWIFLFYSVYLVTAGVLLPEKYNNSIAVRRNIFLRISLSYGLNR